MSISGEGPDNPGLEAEIEAMLQGDIDALRRQRTRARRGVTAPREDASALVARVRGVLSGPPHPFQHEWSDEHTLTTADIESLCTLVEQGERDRRRLDWLERDHNAKVYPAMLDGDFGVMVESEQGRGFSLQGKARTAIDAAMQPNDSAARTGQEG